MYDGIFMTFSTNAPQLTLIANALWCGPFYFVLLVVSGEVRDGAGVVGLFW